jgi:hypothetical protein
MSAFDPTRQVSDEEFENFLEQAAEMMRQANIRPEIIYAFRKTGILPSEKTFKKYTKAQQKAWLDAIREFEQSNAASSSGS